MGPGLRRGNGEGCEGRRWNLPREASAARHGITRPRLNDLLRGNLGKVSPGALVNLATAAGLRLEIRAEVEA
jgi:predicted XRE-type DNA-binding protein